MSLNDGSGKVVVVKSIGFLILLCWGCLANVNSIAGGKPKTNRYSVEKWLVEKKDMQTCVEGYVSGLSDHPNNTEEGRRKTAQSLQQKGWELLPNENACTGKVRKNFSTWRQVNEGDVREKLLELNFPEKSLSGPIEPNKNGNSNIVGWLLKAVKHRSVKKKNSKQAKTAADHANNSQVDSEAVIAWGALGAILLQF